MMTTVMQSSTNLFRRRRVFPFFFTLVYVSATDLSWDLMWRPKEARRASCALNFFGLVKQFDVILPSIQKHLLDTNPTCDVYAHTYNVSHTTNPRNREHNEDIYPNDVFKLTANVIMDTDKMFHTTHNVTFYRAFFPPKKSGWHYPTSMDNMIKQWHSIERAWGRMQSAEEAVGVRYKRVGFFRLDTLFTTPIDVNDGDAVIPNFGMYPMNDRMFYGTREHAEVWATARFPSVASYLKHHSYIRSENYIKWLMKAIPVTLKPICFHRVRAHGTIKNDC